MNHNREQNAAMSRRRFPRVPAENKVLVREPGDTPRAEFSETKSVSLGGCGFRSELELDVDSRIELLILVEPRLLKIQSRVAYSLAATGGGYDVGVEFLQLGQQEKEILQGLLEAESQDRDPAE